MPPTSPAGKQVKAVRVGLTKEIAEVFDEARWALRAKSDGELGARLIVEGMKKLGLLDEAGKPLKTKTRGTK